MAAPTDVLSRIDEIESELRGLSAELQSSASSSPRLPSHPRTRAGPAPSALVTQAAAPVPPPVAPRPSTRQCASRPRSPPPHPSLRGRAERGARRARAGDRVLAYRPAGSAAARIDPRGNRALSVVRAHAGRGACRDGARRGGRGREARAPSAAPVTPPEAPAPPRARRAAGARGPGHAGDPGQAGPDPPHGRAARRRLGPARPARLRDHRRRRHGVRHHPALRARREPRLDHAGDARRVRRLRLGGGRRRCVLGAVALRPAADVARRRRRGHRGRLRNAGRGRGPLRPRARLARAPARRRPRGGRRRDRDRMVVRDGGRDRAARGGARPGPAGDRHGAVVALRGVRGDHPRLRRWCSPCRVAGTSC